MNTQKRFKWAYVPLLFMLVICMLLGSMGLGVTANAASGKVVDGEYTTTNEDTGYYMTISTSGLKFCTITNVILGNVGGINFAKDDGGNPFKSVKRTMSFIFTFIGFDFKNEGTGLSSNLLVDSPIEILCPPVASFSSEYEFVGGDITMNLRKGYYDMFKKNEHLLNNFYITALYENKGEPLYTLGVLLWSNLDDHKRFTDVNVKMHTIHDGASHPGNGGDNIKDNDPKEVSWFEMAYRFLKNLFKWTLTFEEFQKWAIGICVVLVILLAIGFLRKIFGK